MAFIFNVLQVTPAALAFSFSSLGKIDATDWVAKKKAKKSDRAIIRTMWGHWAVTLLVGLHFAAQLNKFIHSFSPVQTKPKPSQIIYALHFCTLLFLFAFIKNFIKKNFSRLFCAKWVHLKEKVKAATIELWFPLGTVRPRLLQLCSAPILSKLAGFNGGKIF